MNAALDSLANQDGRLGSLVTLATKLHGCACGLPRDDCGARGPSSVQRLGSAAVREGRSAAWRVG